MAGRFLFRKLSSRMSRSSSLLGAYASDSAAAGVPLPRRAWEGGIRNLRYIFNGASAHCSTAVPNLPGTHAARYCDTLPCTRAASETGSLGSGIPSAITLKPAFVNPVGVKQTFSSTTSTNDTISSKHKVPASCAEREGKWASDKAAMEADLAAWSAKKDEEIAAFGRCMTFISGSWGLIFGGWFAMEYMSSHGDQSSYGVQSGSHCCSSCCKYQSKGRNPKNE